MLPANRIFMDYDESKQRFPFRGWNKFSMCLTHGTETLSYTCNMFVCPVKLQINICAFHIFICGSLKTLYKKWFFQHLIICFLTFLINTDLHHILCILKTISIDQPLTLSHMLFVDLSLSKTSHRSKKRSKNCWASEFLNKCVVIILTTIF